MGAKRLLADTSTELFSKLKKPCDGALVGLIHLDQAAILLEPVIHEFLTLPQLDPRSWVRSQPNFKLARDCELLCDGNGKKVVKVKAFKLDKCLLPLPQVLQIFGMPFRFGSSSRETLL